MANNVRLQPLGPGSGAYPSDTTMRTTESAEAGSVGAHIQHIRADDGTGNHVMPVSATDLDVRALNSTDDVVTAIQGGTWNVNAQSTDFDIRNLNSTDDYVMAMDYHAETAAGNVSGASALNKFGKNPDVDTAAPEDVWDGGGTWVAPTQARLHNLVSDSANDTSAGTGARTVSVLGLDANYAEITETVTLAGLTPVPTVNSYIIIYRMIVLSAGSGGVNAGNITATAQTDATITAQISTGYNQTLMAIWQVPAGKTLLLNSYYASMNGTTAATSVDIRLWAKPFGQTWQTKHVLGLISTGTSYMLHEFCPPLKFAEKTLIRIQAADASANNVDVSAGFDGVYR